MDLKEDDFEDVDTVVGMDTEDGRFEFINFSLNKEGESEEVRLREKVRKVGGVTNKQIYIAGLRTIAGSPEFRKKLDDLKNL